MNRLLLTCGLVVALVLIVAFVRGTWWVFIIGGLLAVLLIARWNHWGESVDQ